MASSADIRIPSCTDRPFSVLVVERELIVREIVVRKLGSLGYQCDDFADSPSALRQLTSESYDLLLTDIGSAETDGISLLKSTLALHPDMAVILTTSVVNLAAAVAALKEGAYDYILKPFSLEDISNSVSRALDKRRLSLENREHQRVLEEQVSIRTLQLQDALGILHQTYHSTLLALSRALDSRDADMDGKHSWRVTRYTMRLAHELGIEGGKLRALEQGALLHDVGKLGVPDGLLRKPEKLTGKEWEVMHKHPKIGFRILSGIKFLKDAARIVLHHQERYDGTGYPSGLKGEEIDLGARIFAVADALDCMTSNRPFWKATSFEQAREEIRRVAGTQLDPSIVDAFLNIPVEEWRGIRKEVNPEAPGLRPDALTAHR